MHAVISKGAGHGVVLELTVAVDSLCFICLQTSIRGMQLVFDFQLRWSMPGQFDRRES